MRAPGPKKTSGTLIIALIGDSIADGVGADPTGDGSDGLAFGGAAIPAGAAIYDDGVLLTHYPDSAGSGPDPGYLPHLVETALALGFSGVEIHRWSVPGNTTTNIRNNRFPELANELAAAGKEPDLALVVGGTNDSQPGEAAGFATVAPLLFDDLRRTWPNARRGWVEPTVVQQSGWDEVELVKGYIRALVAADPYAFAVDGDNIPASSTNHPNLAGYRTQGRQAIPQYLAGR